MDLYEAIEVLSDYVTYLCDYDRPFAVPTKEELQAIKICLEAAKDKAGM